MSHDESNQKFFEHMARKAYWTIGQGCILISGQASESLLERLERDTNTSIHYQENLSCFGKEINECYKTIHSHVLMKKLSHMPTPHQFLQFVINLGYDVSEVLQKAVEKISKNFLISPKKYHELSEHLDEITRQNEILKSENEELKSSIPEKIDSNHTYYSTELQIAIDLQQELIKNPSSSKTPKQQAKAILKKRYPNFSAEKIERIATIVNPEKYKRNGGNS